MGSEEEGLGALIVLRVVEPVCMQGGSVGDGWGAVGGREEWG